MERRNVMPKRSMILVLALFLTGTAAAADLSAAAGSLDASKMKERVDTYAAQDKLIEEARNLFGEKKFAAAAAKLEQVLAELDLETASFKSEVGTSRLQAVRREVRRIRHAWGRDILHQARLVAAENRFEDAANIANEAVKLAVAARDIPGLEGVVDAALQDEASKLVAYCRGMASAEKVRQDTSFDSAKGVGYDKRKTQIRVLLREARTFMKANRFEEALERVEKVFVLDPFDTEAITIGNAIYRRFYDYGMRRAESDISMINAFGEWQWAEPVFARNSGSSDVAEAQVKGESNQAAHAKLARIVYPRFEFEDADIAAVLRLLNNRNKDYDPEREGIVINSGLRPEDSERIRVSMSLNDMPLGELLRYICQETGLKYRVDENSVFIGVDVDEMETQRFQVRGNLIANIISDAKAHGAVAPEVTEAPAGEEGGEGEGEGEGAAPVASAPSAKDKVTEAMLKSYFSKRGVSFAPGSSISYSQQAGLLSVVNTRDSLRRMEELMRQLASIEKPLVLIEVRTLTINEKDLQELGFEWSIGLLGTNNMTNKGGSLTSGNNGWLLGQGENAVAGAALSFLRKGITGIADTSVIKDFNIFPALFGSKNPFGSDMPLDISLTVNALAQNTRAESLAAPKLLTTNGTTADVVLGKRYYFPESWDEAEVEIETSDNIARVTVTAPEPEFNEDGEVYGVSFKATPTVLTDNYTIRLNLEPNISEYIGNDSYEVRLYGYQVLDGERTRSDYVFNIWRPVIARRKMSVVVDVYDGETVVLGGMIQNQVSNQTDKIPILGDLPLIGRFFQSQSETSDKTNLLIFVTARLVDYNGVPVLRSKNTAAPDFKR